jgi:hypothetical protein
LKLPKALSEAVYWRTDDTMNKRKSTKILKKKTLIHKTLLRQLTKDWRTRNLTEKQEVNSGAPEGYALLFPLAEPVVLILLKIGW